ncbi:MAG TPA: hypothetical protein D7I05_08165, partial [Candidatus Poseidoniales archaeon]
SAACGHGRAHVGHVVTLGEKKVFCERICTLFARERLARQRRLVHGELHSRGQPDVGRNLLALFEANEVAREQHVGGDFDVPSITNNNALADHTGLEAFDGLLCFTFLPVAKYRIRSEHDENENCISGLVGVNCKSD